MITIHTVRASLFILFVVLLGSLAGAPSPSGNQPQWITDYDQAAALSKTTQRPMFLFFTGSDWCGWCNKLEKEVLETPEFLGAMGDKLIFVKLDYPMKKKLDAATETQNLQLQKKFSIRSYPTVVILDPDQQPIGVTGYRAGGGKQYAAHLMKMVNEYAAYKDQIRRLGAAKISGKELKRLYQKSQELGLKNDQNSIVRKGMESDLSPFFIAERYRFLVSENQGRSEEASTLKQRLAQSDPENKTLAHYQIAMIDYEANCELIQKEEIDANQAAEPLLTYLHTYGPADQENAWKVNYILTQFYLNQNLLEQALKYAQDSLAAAPAPVQEDISRTISNIEKKIDPSKKTTP